MRPGLNGLIGEGNVTWCGKGRTERGKTRFSIQLNEGNLFPHSMTA